MSLRVVLCTAPPEKAGDLAKEIVGRRLAACVNIVPGLRSIYRWQGEICDDAEALMVIKTRAECVAALTEAILELHPYDTPEVIALPIEDGAGNPAYLQWLLDESGG
jgi:periplasmic divalent cation tolerance protein